MHTHHRSPSPARPAFTLVELIVAIAIIAFIAGLAVLLIPSLQDNQRVVSGADQVAGTLLLTRQWSMRDQLSRGVRLNLAKDPDHNNLMYVHSLQYMEQPDYFVATPPMAIIGMTNPLGLPDVGGNLPNTFLVGGVVTLPTGNTAVAMNTLAQPFVDFFAGFGPPPASQFSSWTVQPGDYLDLMGNNKADALYKFVLPSPVPPALRYGGILASKNPATPNVGDNLVVTNVPQTTLSLLAAPPPSGWPANIQAIQLVYPNFVPFQNPLPFRILRGPRPMAGQQPINLPTDIVVDYPDPLPNTFPFFLPPPPPGQPVLPHPPQLELLPANLQPAPWPALAPPLVYGSIVTPDSQTGQVDIMFSPSGKVTRDAGNQGKVVLWVYDLSDPRGGAMTLVTIYTRTGVISTHPVNLTVIDPTNGLVDPYAFVKDGRSSGM